MLLGKVLNSSDDHDGAKGEGVGIEEASIPFVGVGDGLRSSSASF